MPAGPPEGGITSIRKQGIMSAVMEGAVIQTENLSKVYKRWFRPGTFSDPGEWTPEAGLYFRWPSFYLLPQSVSRYFTPPLPQPGSVPLHKARF